VLAFEEPRDQDREVRAQRHRIWFAFVAYIRQSVVFTSLETFADVAHPLLMAGKTTMPAFFDGKYYMAVRHVLRYKAS